MESDIKPRIGAALTIRSLDNYRSWLISGQRDLEIQDAALPSTLDGDWKALARQAQELLSGYKGRLGIHGPFIGFNLAAGFDKILRNAVAGRLKQALDFASELGASHMVVHSPFMFFGSSPFAISRGEKGLFNEEAFIRSLLDEVVEYAQRSGCILMIENIEDLNPEPLLGLVRSYDSEYVRMSLDVGHAFITHKRGGPTPDQWVRDAGALLGHLHIQDSDGETDRHWAPGDGDLNWHALFEALGTLKQSPRMMLELSDHRNVEKGARYLASRGFVE
jgi:sugar phosphate isomerase/epimerase